MPEVFLTPRQVVDALVEMHSTFVQYNRGDRDPVLVPTTGGKLRAWPAALEAALAAYKREHLRAWLKAERLTWEYPVHVVPEVKADGSPCYEAYYPDLLGCRAQGDTPEEAKAALAAAKRQYLEILLGQGDEPPKPSTRSTVTWLSFGPPTAKASLLDGMIREFAAGPAEEGPAP